MGYYRGRGIEEYCQSYRTMPSTTLGALRNQQQMGAGQRGFRERRCHSQATPTPRFGRFRRIRCAAVCDQNIAVEPLRQACLREAATGHVDAGQRRRPGRGRRGQRKRTRRTGRRQRRTGATDMEKDMARRQSLFRRRARPHPGATDSVEAARWQSRIRRRARQQRRTGATDPVEAAHRQSLPRRRARPHPYSSAARRQSLLRRRARPVRGAARRGRACAGARVQGIVMCEATDTTRDAKPSTC